MYFIVIIKTRNIIFVLQDLKSINRIKTLQSSGKELDNNQLARLKLENGLLSELKRLQL